MEWTPSDKMTITNPRAVLASWDVPTLRNDKGVLIKEVATHYHEIMMSRMAKRPVVPAFVSGLPVFAPGVARSSGGSHKAVGTDTPAMVTSYIGSEEAADDDNLNTNIRNLISIININDDVAAQIEERPHYALERPAVEPPCVTMATEHVAVWLPAVCTIRYESVGCTRKLRGCRRCCCCW